MSIEGSPRVITQSQRVHRYMEVESELGIVLLRRRQHQRIGVADAWFRDHCDMRTANTGLEYLAAYRVSSNLILHRCMQ